MKINPYQLSTTIKLIITVVLKCYITFVINLIMVMNGTTAYRIIFILNCLQNVLLCLAITCWYILYKQTQRHKSIECVLGKVAKLKVINHVILNRNGTYVLVCNR
jgi:hypothetical protein